MARGPRLERLPLRAPAPGRGALFLDEDAELTIAGSAPTEQLPARVGRHGRLRVLIAGGGVAGLETLLALHALAGELVEIELLSLEHFFWYRPLAVAEPFAAGRAHRFELAALAATAGACCFTPGQLSEVETELRLAHTSNGMKIPYDVLVIACGASPQPALAGALTFRGPADSEAFARLLGELEAGGITSLVFAIPKGVAWPLPLYELALLTARHLLERAIDEIELALVTPETAPLALFGQPASELVAELLSERRIALHTGHYPARFAQGRLELVPRATLPADRVVALPRLEGQPIAGIPQDANGFIATDASGRVRGLEDVYAAGDITNFPLKQGGIAAQQADAVAEAVAARAGGSLKPRPFEPVLRGLLLPGRSPAYLCAELRGGRGDTSSAAREALWWPPAKIAGRYLAPFLAAHANLEIEAPSGMAALAIEHELADEPPA